MTTAAALRAAAQSLRSPFGIGGPGTAEAQLDALAAAQELRNTLDAMVNDLLVAIVVTEDPQLLADDDGSPRDLVEVHEHLEETYAAELAAPCLGVSVHVAYTRCHNALGLATRAPALVEQMRAGCLDGFRATLVHGELDEAPAEVEAAIVDELVVRAERRGQWDETAGPLTSRARALLARRAPAFVAEQAATQREQRELTKRGDCLVAGDIAKAFTPSMRRATPCRVTAGGTHIDDVDPRYRVPAAISRFVKFRHKTCRFPNCNVSQRFCDLDHVIPWPDGPTSPSNLMALCRRHHRLKQRPGWSVQLLPDATTVWTDPVGRELTTRPVDLLGSSLPPAPSGADAGWSPLERHLADLLSA